MQNKTKQIKLEITKKEDKIKYYSAFSFLNVRPLFKSKLLEYFDFNIIEAFNADEKDLAQIREIYNIPIPRDFLFKRDKLNLDECFEKAFRDDDIKIICADDDNYPCLLKEIPDFPISLYYKGSLDNLDCNFNLAVVGSRKATENGKIALNEIISGLNSENVSITSGLAYGIDTQAHKSALENNIRTYAVVGCGLDIIYPTQNKNLFNEIIEKGGAVISEFPLKTPPLAPNFPQRNRIVVGLSIATLVAEAQLKSGAMISANLALDYNRELMCIPGNVMNPNTTGIYHLIKNGAGIVCETKDILSYLNWEMKVTSKESTYDLTQDQEDVFEILSLEPKTFDEIALTAKMDVSKLMVVLTELELKGLIKQIDNKFFKCK